MCLPQRSRAALRQANVGKVAFVLERFERLHHFLDCYIVRDARGLEEIHLLYAAEGLVDRLHAAPQVLRPTGVRLLIRVR